ncbi:16S rRNA (guanine(527)-N(7))-methyltransferase RsmG [bacterium BFN5]|nr:16S rRNA (guanine(527)-N(7))-methyltransferase RsmG [bacterium BFN5]
MEFQSTLRRAAVQFGLELSQDQLEAFYTYYSLLVEWNNKINLTAITEPEEVAVKHMIDSLSCYDAEVFTPGCSVIDVGTGAGFPGLPLKMIHSDIKLTLLDSLNKRVNFLQQVVDSLHLKEVAVIHSRAEEGARQKLYREQYNVLVHLLL